MKTLDDLKIECLSRYILGTDPGIKSIYGGCNLFDHRLSPRYIKACSRLGSRWRPPKGWQWFYWLSKISDEQYVISACAFMNEFVWINWEKD